MSKRKAKKLALFHASLILRTAMDGSFICAELAECEGDEDRLILAFAQIADELERRGSR